MTTRDDYPLMSAWAEDPEVVYSARAMYSRALNEIEMLRTAGRALLDSLESGSHGDCTQDPCSICTACEDMQSLLAPEAFQDYVSRGSATPPPPRPQGMGGPVGCRITCHRSDMAG